jgi:hypothetical protein
MNQQNEISFQIINTNDLDDNHNILINLLAALRNNDNTSVHRIGSKGKYKQTCISLLSGKNIICGDFRKGNSEEIRISLSNDEVLNNLIYLLNYILTIYIINSYCCNHLLLLEKRSPTVEMLPISLAQLEYRKLMMESQFKASRRTAAEQKGSHREFYYHYIC